MKVGDTVEVTIAGQTVAQAKVTEMGADRATLVIPGTVVVMGVRTDLAPEVTAPVEEPTRQTIVDEVVRVDSKEPTSEITETVQAQSTETPVEASAPVEQTAPPVAPVEQTTEPDTSAVDADVKD